MGSDEEEDLKLLADLAIANLESHRDEDLFDVYSQRLTAHLYANVPYFHERFFKGYQSLMLSLKESEKSF